MLSDPEYNIKMSQRFQSTLAYLHNRI